MFDKYIIVEDTLRNVDNGYELGIRMPYYRGLGLSMVEAIDLRVDGSQVPTDAITFTVHGHSYPLSALATTFDDRWEMGEIATLTVNHSGGLAAGRHSVEVAQRLRISYMPVPGGGKDAKELIVAG